MACERIPTRPTAIFAVASSLALLSACGGDGGGGGGGPVVYSYDMLRDAEAEGTLGGTARYRNLISESGQVSALTGSLTREGGPNFPRIELDIGEQAGGFEGPGEFDSDDERFVERVEQSTRETTILKLPENFTAGRYDYVTPYVTEFRRNPLGPEASQAHDFWGVVGMITEVGDMPRSGTVMYQGDALGEAAVLVDSASEEIVTYQLRGVAMVEADFSEGEVDISMTDFTVRGADGAANNGLLTGIRIVKMEINENTFTGGLIEINENFRGTIGRQIVGSHGTFFGPDGVEVGGSILTDDDLRVIDSGLDITFVAKTP